MAKPSEISCSLRLRAIPRQALLLIPRIFAQPFRRADSGWLKESPAEQLYDALTVREMNQEALDADQKRGSGTRRI